MDILVLGPVEALRDDVALSLGGPKQRTVLGLLAARAGTVVSTDALLDGLWGADPTPGARSTLQTYISNLRHELGDVIVHDGAGYRLDADPQQVDAIRFEEAVAAARDLVETEPAGASQMLREALALWRGHPYGDVAESLLLELEGHRLEEVRLGAVEARIEAELALGHHADLVPELEVLCAEFPLREEFRAQHMLALYRSGRQAEALRAYQKTRAYLDEELGLEPGGRLRELERRILNQDESLLLEIEPRIQTVAFLLTDIEGSTVLWETQTAAMRSAIAQHDRIVNDAVEHAGGRVVKRVGDGIDLAFGDVGAAVRAAEEIARGLAAVEWGETGALRVRVAIDVGEVEARDADYFGPVLNRAGRILAAGHGGQVLLSADAHTALAATEAGWQAKALGEFRFKGIGSPQNVFQLLLDGMPSEFPPLRIDRLPPLVPAVAFGRSLRGYELREQVGTGDFGIVYRAYQPSVGREVAIKVIRPELVNQPAFVRGFEAEAQLVAQLEHPHIVSLYDYWRDPDGAYLVMRWLRGGSLQRALDRGPWNIEPASRLLAQVGSALSYAHRQGVVHGDLKPANVLLDDEGHAYLSDFGIASRLAGTSELAVVNSSPAYVPPEELEGAPRAPRSDLYCLGLLAFELLSGRRPPMDYALPSLAELRSQLPESLDRVIAKATAADPGKRYESVDAFIVGFEEALGGVKAATTEVYTPVENPYKGLQAFDQADADDFYGRDKLVAELVAAVGKHRLVAVVGPSGIGKSSVVKAGLIPELRQGALDGSQTWLFSDMFPGSYPYEELSAALLRVAVERRDGLVEELARDELGMTRVMKQVLPPDAELLLVVDQFEELFTLTTDEEIRRRFLDGLVRLTTDSRSRTRVVVTLRADFLDHPLRYPEFGELLRAGMVAVTVPSADELAEAIELPAGRVGVRFEPGLVSRIVADVEDQPGGLPLLQYALTELFAARTTDVLTLEEYLATGGVVGALGRRAEELYGQLDPPGKDAARQVFLRLVSVDPQAQDTRRRVRNRELRRLELEPAALDEVLGSYGEHRLLTFDREPLTRSPTVEVAHEALLAQWERLRSWVDERREDLLLHRRLVEAVEEWEDSGREADYLPREGRLVQFEAWAAATDIAMTAGEREFLAESRAAADAGARRRTRLRRGILAGFAGLAIATSAAAVFAFVQRGEAEQQARLSKARALAAGAQDAVDKDPELSLLLALEGVKTTRSAGEPVIPEVVEALHTAVNNPRILRRIPNEAELAVWSPDGRGLAISAHDDPNVGDAFVTVIDPRTGDEVSSLRRRQGDGRLTGVTFDGTGERLATTHERNAAAIVWDTDTGRRLRTIPGRGKSMISPVFTPDGKKLVVSNHDGTVSMLSLTSGSELYRVRGVRTGTAEIGGAILYGSSGASLVDISPDGRWLATAEPGLPGAVLRRAADGRPVHTLRTPNELTELTFSVAFSPRGDRIAVLEELPGFVDIFDVATGRLLKHQLAGASLLSFDWSADGKRIAVAGNDAVVSIVDVAASVTSLSLRGHAEPVTAVAFSPDGSRLASAGWRTNTLVWDLTPVGRSELAVSSADLGYVTWLVPSPDGSRIYTSSFLDGFVHALDATTGEVVRTIPNQLVSHKVSIALSPDGRWLATTDAKSKVTSILGTRTFRRRYELPRGLHVRAFSPDGAQVLVDTTGKSKRGAVRVLDVATGRTAVRLQGRSGWIGGAEWSPDGSLLATASFDHFARVYDARSGELLVQIPVGERIEATDVSFRPDGSQLAISSHDVVIYDVDAIRARRVELVARLPNRSGSTDIRTVQFTSDGSELVTGSLNPELVVWDTSSWESKYTIRTPGPSAGMAVLPSGREVMFAVGVVYTLDVDRLIEIARDRLTRSFTTAECIRYLHVDECPQD